MGKSRALVKPDCPTCKTNLHCRHLNSNRYWQKGGTVFKDIETWECAPCTTRFGHRVGQSGTAIRLGIDEEVLALWQQVETFIL